MISTSTLNSYVNKHISAICYNNYAEDGTNHCAHFVAHVLEIHVETKCHNVGPTMYPVKPGASLRVNEIFNFWCGAVGPWDHKPTSLAQCLFFISIPSNVTGRPLRTGTNSTKHIGIYIGGTVWHYSNSKRKVVRVPVAQMKKHYSGQKDDWLFYGTLR